MLVYVYLEEKNYTFRTEQIAPGISIDYGPNNMVVGIEFTRALRVTTENVDEETVLAERDRAFRAIVG